MIRMGANGVLRTPAPARLCQERLQLIRLSHCRALNCFFLLLCFILPFLFPHICTWCDCFCIICVCGCGCHKPWNGIKTPDTEVIQYMRFRIVILFVEFIKWDKERKERRRRRSLNIWWWRWRLWHSTGWRSASHATVWMARNEVTWCFIATTENICDDEIWE